MPSLNNFFRRFRDNAEWKKHRKSDQAQENMPPTADPHHLNVSSLSSSSGPIGGGIGGCCSRKTSSTMSKEHHPMGRLANMPSRKGSSSSAKFCPLPPEQSLPDTLLCRIFDSIESPFEFVRLRRLNKAVAGFVQAKTSRVTEMDLRRVHFDTLSSTSTGSSSGQPDTTVIVEGEVWHVHPSGCKVLCRVLPIEECRVEDEGKEEGQPKTESVQQFRLEVLVDEQWTSREIVVLCSLVNEFRRFVRRISLDAPIFELIVANLAAVDLDRWFAFQCFVKAVDEGQMNAALNKLAAQLQQQQQEEPDSLNDSEPDKLYWPNAKTILIRTTERESVHLARLLNYGVRSNLVMDRRRLDRLSLLVCVTDANKTRSAERPKQLVRNLYHFRCWAGSPGFDERFSQQWRVGGRVA